jgi:putative acyl-CoA dehydrogenase
MATHDVLNQPPPLVDYDLFRSDRALTDAVRCQGAAWAEAELSALGRTLGRAETIHWGHEANRNPPELHAFDRYGHRQDKVAFHPAWHEMMTLGIAAGRKLLS